MYDLQNRGLTVDVALLRLVFYTIFFNLGKRFLFNLPILIKYVEMFTVLFIINQ